jgi:hypothetical protein
MVRNNAEANETILFNNRKWLETEGVHACWVIKQWGSVMWAILNIFYRKYCLARLQEMRRFELLHRSLFVDCWVTMMDDGKLAAQALDDAQRILEEYLLPRPRINERMILPGGSCIDWRLVEA